MTVGLSWRSDASYLTRHGDRDDLSEGLDLTLGGPVDQAGRRSPEANYYVAAVEHSGEAPGQWWTRGGAGEHLGLVGEATTKQMELLYGDLLDPTTGAQLGSRKRSFKTYEERLSLCLTRAIGRSGVREGSSEVSAAVSAARASADFVAAISASLGLEGEAVEAAIAAARSTQREAKTYCDVTFSMPKSFSVVHAALLAAGRHDDAAKVWEAVEAGTSATLDYLRSHAGYSRTGYHGARVGESSTGAWVEAPDWVVSLWRHTTNRNGDVQLHIHAAVLNRVLCPDGQWRALDGQAMTRVRPAAAAVGERVAEATLAASLGVRFVDRADGMGREIAGVDAATLALFSTRRSQVTERLAVLAAEWEQSFGQAPDAYALALLSEKATLQTRARKPTHGPDLFTLIERWQTKAEAVVPGGLAKVLSEVGLGLRQPAQGFDPAAVISLAIGDVEAKRSVWRRHDLISALERRLPPSLGALSPAQLEELLERLADDALGTAEIVLLTAPEVVRTPDELRRPGDGRSRYEAPAIERYCTKGQLRREDYLVAMARSRGAAKVSNAVAEQLVIGAGLDGAQGDAARSVLSSGRRAEVLIGPAGTGKTHAVGVIAALWREATGGRVLGVTVAEAASVVLSAAGVETAANATRFLDAQRRLAANQPRPTDAELRVEPGDLVVLDEASMLTTADAFELAQLVRNAGAKLLITGDDHQLSGVGASGAMAMVVRAVPEAVTTLQVVRRMDQAWEQEASLGLRRGEASAVESYDRHGRVAGGNPEAMAAAAVEAYIDALSTGRSAVLVVATNEEATDLSAAVRAALVDLGQVEAQGVALVDGTTAGVGDVVQARKNDWDNLVRGAPVLNRQSFRVLEALHDGSLTVVPVDDRGAPAGPRRRLESSYVAQSVALDYASTAHAVQGRTVDVGLCVVSEQSSRAGVYVGGSRGRYENLFFVTCEDPQASAATMVEALDRVEDELSAREVLVQEQSDADHLARLGAIWTDLRTQVQLEAMLVDLDEDLARRLRDDPAAAALAERLDAYALSGADPRVVLAQAVASRELETAKAPAAVLYSRLGPPPAPVQPSAASSYVERTKVEPNGPVEKYLLEVAKAMDARTAALGEAAAAQPPAWAAQLGPVPADALEATQWKERAAAVAAYREQYVITDESAPLGPPPRRDAGAQRETWSHAWATLGGPEHRRPMAERSDDDLYRLEAKWAASLRQAPSYVSAAEQRDAHQNARRWRIETERQVRRPVEHLEGAALVEHATRTEGLRLLQLRAEAQAKALDTIALARTRWHHATETERTEATEAVRELRTRHPEAVRAPLRETSKAPAPEVDSPALVREHLADRLAHARSVLDDLSARDAEMAAARERAVDSLAHLVVRDSSRYPGLGLQGPER